MWQRLVRTLGFVSVLMFNLTVVAHFLLGPYYCLILLDATILLAVIPLFSILNYYLRLPSICKYNTVYQVELVDISVHQSWQFFFKRSDPLYLNKLQQQGLLEVIYAYPSVFDNESSLLPEAKGHRISCHRENQSYLIGLLVSPTWPIVQDHTLVSLAIPVDAWDNQMWAISSIVEIPVAARKEYNLVKLFNFNQGAA